MPRIDQAHVNFAIYEDSVEYLGIVQATLPNLEQITQELSGAGIAGNVEAVYRGHFSAMTLGLTFRTMTPESIKLAEPRRHTIDLRVARQDEDTEGGQIVIVPVKHIFVVVPKSLNPGNVAPHSTADGSGQYAVRYWATFMDGKMVTEIDQLNYKCVVDGVDYLASVRAALGK